MQTPILGGILTVYLVYSTVLGVVITYLLIEGYHRMNGSLQLETRGWNRRAAIQYMRIEEARDYLDTLLCAFRKLTHIHRNARFSGKINARTDTFEEILWLIDVAGKKRFHIRSLDDAALADLDDRLVRVVQGKHGNISEFVGTMNYSRDVNKSFLIENMSEQYENALALIRAMEVRLNQLTETWV